LQNLFPPKGSLVNAPQKEKKGGKKSKRSGEERKQCPNFESCNLASGTKASPVLDL